MGFEKLALIIGLLVTINYHSFRNVNAAFHYQTNEREFKAIKRSNNDFVTFRDSLSPRVEIPGAVKRVIQKEIQKQGDQKLDCIFYIVYNDSVGIYVFKTYAFGGPITEYHFLAYNEKAKRITKKPISINGTAMDNNEEGFSLNDKLLISPVFEILKMEKDKASKILIRQRMHNGNTYNAIIAHYFTLLPDLSFKNYKNIEEVYKCVSSNCLIKRKILDNKISSYLYCNNSDSIFIGEVGLHDDFKIFKRKVVNPEYSNLLITGNGSVSDEIFLRESLYDKKGNYFY